MSATATTFISFGVTFALIGLALAVRSRQAARQDRADDLEAARLRLLADGVDVYDLPVPSWDGRTQALAVDPTLRRTEVAEMVAHVAPGAGSVASLAHTTQDTRIRSAGQLAELREAEEAAYAEAATREDREFFARFDLVMSVALAGFRERTVRADNWLHYVHDDACADCPHCTAALHEVSDEYAQIVRRVEAQDTGVFSRAELAELLAVHA